MLQILPQIGLGVVILLRIFSGDRIEHYICYCLSLGVDFGVFGVKGRSPYQIIHLKNSGDFCKQVAHQPQNLLRGVTLCFYKLKPHLILEHNHLKKTPEVDLDDEGPHLVFPGVISLPDQHTGVTMPHLLIDMLVEAYYLDRDDTLVKIVLLEVGI